MSARVAMFFVACRTDLPGRALRRRATRPETTTITAATTMAISRLISSPESRTNGSASTPAPAGTPDPSVAPDIPPPELPRACLAA